MTEVDPRFRVAYLLSKETGEIALLSGLTALVMSIGFMIGSSDATNLNYQLIYQFANQYIWSSLFALYGMLKVAGCFYRIPDAIRMINGVLGIWAWNYIFLSFTVFDPTPMAPTEILLAIPILAEFWNMIALPHPILWHRRRKDYAKQ